MSNSAERQNNPMLLSLNESLPLPTIEAALPLTAIYEDMADALTRR